MIYRFDDFQLNTATRELHRRGEPVALPARAFDCLAYLVDRRERAVGRDELVAAVWGRVEISEALLSHTIVKLRRSLGDTGNEQRSVRTVPRFGYRWVPSVEVVPETVVAPADQTATTASIVSPTDPIDPSRAAASGTDISKALDRDARPPAHATTRAPRRFLAITVTAILLVAAIVAWRAATTTSPAQAPIAANPGIAPTQAPAAVSVLILPAEIRAPAEWQWLRLGLMDLIANRLRGADVQTAASETVVGLLRQRRADGDLLHDVSLAEVAALRVQPHVDLDGSRWRVRLDAFGAQATFAVEAQAADAIGAAREAADALLRKLGHAPGARADAGSPALDELLQRSGAAMLADQLDQARALIAAAPADLQQQPAIEQRMAQIELRSGEYAHVETRLHALLDRLSPEKDAALRARALLTLAAAYVRRDEADEAVDLYAEAISLRREPPDHEVLGVAYLGRGAVLAQEGHYEQATAELSRARTELNTVGDGLGVAGVDVNLGGFDLLRHRPADALAVLRNAAAQFERLGAREGRAYALTQQALAEGELLDLDAALATTRRLWPPEANTNNLRMRWSLVFAHAQALAAAGRLDAAQAIVERIRRDADPQKDLVLRLQGELLAAGIAVARSDPARATDLVAGALKPALRDADPIAWTRGLVLQARALRDSGRSGAAASVAALRSWADGSDDAWRRVYADLAGAEQTWAEHRREAALEQFAKAWQASDRQNVPEDLVEVGAAYLGALVEASQLDTARAVAGRIAMWADRDLRAATAQARLYRALGHEDAARQADETIARLHGRAARADD